MLVEKTLHFDVTKRNLVIYTHCGGRGSGFNIRVWEN
jgi:hypothetical protein